MFWAVVILLLVTDGIAGSLYDKFHVVTELSQIEAHLKELDSELGKLDSNLDKTSNAVSKLKSEISGETKVRDESVDLVPFVPCVRSLDAWRTVKSGELRLTMKYLELADDVKVMWVDTITVLPATFYELSPGDAVGKFMNSSVTVPDNITSDSMIFMAARCGGNGNWQAYQFRLNGDNSAHQVLSEDAMPVVEMNTSEVVYNIGQDAYFKMRTKRPENRDGNQIQTDVILSLVDFKTGEFEMRFLADYVNKSVEFLNSKVDANSSEATIRMKMSERMKSGIIMMSSYKMMEGSVISFISEYFHVYVRPSNQTGPFPPDYIHINIPPHKQTDDKEITKETCSINTICPIICDAIGDDVEKVDLIQVNPDGTRLELERETLSFNYEFDSKYSKSTTIFVKVDASFNEDVKYLCVATNKNGKQATHYFAINAYIPLKIIRDKSSIVIGNGQLNITCTATGRPEPTITFDMSTNGGQWYYLYTPDTVTDLGNNTYRATKLADYDQATMGKLLSASCFVKGADGGRYDDDYQYSYDIPHQVN